MVKKISSTTRSRASVATKRRLKPSVLDKEERILRAATIHLLYNYGHLLVATDLREASVRGFRVWIITVTLRYPTGFEGYVGDLLYDGKGFTFLTPQSVMDKRLRDIEADPEGIREWNEFRASTVRAGKT